MEGGEGKKLWRSGEARRRESQEVGQTVAPAGKQTKAYTLHCAREKMPWPALCFIMAPPFLGACLKRTIPTNIGNSFKEKLEGN